MRFFISGLFFVVLTITAVTANSAVDVVVIGAGASGITAASGLLKQGYRVKILDAENRIGGRLHSVPYGNGFVELGGQAVWGQNNTLYDYVRDEDLIAGGGPVPVPIGNAPGVANLADIGGEIKDERELAQINHVWAALHGALVNLDNFNNTNNISVGEYFDNAIADYIKNNNITDPGTVVLAQTVYDYVVRMLKTEDGLDSLHDLSIHGYIDRRDRNFRAALKIPYIEAIRRLGGNFSIKHFHLNQRVVGISFNASESHPITITTATGDQFKAHHVIVTVSLGVLKEEGQLVFTPALPKKKRDAITQAGFGTLGKVILVYEAPFWNKIKDKIGNMPFLWTEDSNVSETDPERRYAGRQWTRAIDEIKVFGQPAFTISGFLGGRHGIDMEALTDEEVIANMTSIIGQFTKLVVPQPLKLLRGQWHSNPNFRGTHSYISENFFENGFKLADLAEPEWTYESLISGTKVSALLFAGEATHDTYFSHVTGAVDSGIREASRIIKYYSRDTSTPAPGTGSPAPGGSGLSLHQTNLIVLVIMFAVVIYQQL